MGQVHKYSAMHALSRMEKRQLNCMSLTYMSSQVYRALVTERRSAISAHLMSCTDDGGWPFVYYILRWCSNQIHICL